jgi:hypothetical protein
MGARGVLRTAEGGRLLFWCPGCEEVHMVGPSWTFNGDFDRPTFAPSIKVSGKRRITDEEYDRIMGGEKLEVPDMCCHSFIRDGQIQFLGDCTHPLAGQTLPLQPFDEAA